MASTTRRKITIKEEIKPEPEVVSATPSFPEVLAAEHLLQLEVKSRDIENAKLLMAVEEQSLKNMLLEQQILQQKVEKQKLLLQQRAIYYDNMAKQFRQLKAELWPQYGFSSEEGLGYDPATGEIRKP